MGEPLYVVYEASHRDGTEVGACAWGPFTEEQLKIELSRFQRAGMIVIPVPLYRPSWS